MGTDIGASLIRTVVPLVVGAIVAFLASHQIDATKHEDFLAQLVGAGVAGLYYLAVRYLEVYVRPRFGWLLGKPGAPVYDPGANAYEP